MGVVDRTRAFAESQRREVVEEMHRRVQEFARVLPRLEPGRHPELIKMARSTLQELEKALAQLES